MDYIAKLQDYNLKVIPQRLEIVDILYTKGHITVDDLYTALQKKFPTLSLATIYKKHNQSCSILKSLHVRYEFCGVKWLLPYMCKNALK